MHKKQKYKQFLQKNEYIVLNLHPKTKNMTTKSIWKIE